MPGRSPPPSRRLLWPACSPALLPRGAPWASTPPRRCGTNDACPSAERGSHIADCEWRIADCDSGSRIADRGLALMHLDHVSRQVLQPRRAERAHVAGKVGLQDLENGLNAVGAV